MQDDSKDAKTTGFEVAVIGMAGRFPKARDLAAFWRNIRDGVECLTTFSDEQLLASGVGREWFSDPHYVRRGGVLDDGELFDAAFFGITPRDAEILDPQHRFFLECAWEALEDAGYDPETCKKPIGVFAGAGRNTYLLLNLFTQDPDAALGLVNMLANDSDYLTTRVSYKLNLKGPSVDVQTACSTSLVAVHLACQNLLVGECDMALAGGISLRVPQEVGYYYQEGGNLSPDGYCRAFDERAAGMVCANGVGVVVLKRLSDALADGDSIRAVIKGSAINNDGSGKVGFTAPSVDGQAEAIRRALSLAEVDPDTVSYVEAHGTGTSLGDPIEIAGLTQAFRTRTARKAFCAVGSLKTTIGHTDAAAGVAGLIKTVLSLQHGVLPPSLNFERPNPNIDFANSPFYVNASLREWPRGATPRRAGVSSFGLGGTNAHAVLEEAPPAPPSGESRDWQLVVLSARTLPALDAATANLSQHLRQHPELSPADTAYTLQVGRRRFSHRRYLVCRTLDEASTALEGLGAKRVTGAEEARARRWSRDLAAASLDGLDPKRVVTGVEEARARPVAFMFPGQGAQYVNMGRELYESEPAFREPMDRCSEALAPLLGCDLRQLIYPTADEAAAGERLRQTAFTQPTLFVVEYALSQLWMSWGIKPVAMIGHSIGEYVAACLAGVFRLEDALALVAERGRLMQGLPSGAMVSVRLPLSEVEALLEGSGVELAALNEEKATVVSGPTDAMARLEGRLTSQGAAYQRLNTSHAFHSAMMDPILGTFRARVAEVERRAPQIPYISNLTGAWITEAEATDPVYWARHLREPVRFTQGLRELMRELERVLLEVGPGRVLCGLANSQTDRSRHNVVVSSIRHPQESDSDVQFLLGAVGRLWLAGVDVGWKAFHSRGARRRVPLPRYPFERQRFWVEPGARDASAARRGRDEKRPDPATWFYLPSWRRVALPVPDGAKRGPWLVFADSTGLGERIARRLAQSGEAVVTAVPGGSFGERADGVFELDPAEPRDYTRLIEALDAQGRSPLSIAHVWSVQEGGEGARGGVAQALGFFSLVYLARALDTRAPGVRREIVVVTSGVQDVTGDETLSPDNATVMGPCKVIPQEYAALACRSVDLAASGSAGRDEESVSQVVAELTSATEERAVAYRRGRRWVPCFEPLPLQASPERPGRVREGGVYLVSGGLGGIGLGVAELLARAARAKLVLVGRGALPARADWERWLEANGDGDEVGQRLRRLLALEALGAEVLAVQADVTNPEQLRKAVAEAESRFGALHGVIHAAGVERAFQSIAETGPAEADVQFRPRLGGVAALERALEGRALDFCLVISSLSSVLGGLGSVSYTAAHVFLDVFAARHNRTSKTPWLSVNWDRWFTWRDVSQAPAAGEVGFFMTPAEAQEALRRVLSTDRISQLVVSTGDLEARIDRWIRRIVAEEPKPAAAAAVSLYARPEIGEDYVAPSSPEEHTLARIWSEALGVEKVGVNDDFFELGGDSVLGLRIVAKANEAGLRMTGRHIFEHHTIAELAKALATSAPAPAAPAPVAQEPAGGAATAFPGARLDPKDLEAFLAGLGGGGRTPPK